MLTDANRALFPRTAAAMDNHQDWIGINVEEQILRAFAAYWRASVTAGSRYRSSSPARTTAVVPSPLGSTVIANSTSDDSGEAMTRY